MRQPAVDQRIPCVGLVALVLLIARGLQQLLVLDPPDGPVFEPGYGLGPELVAIACKGININLATAYRPEAPVAGL